MKIKPSITSNVYAAIKNCREVLVRETIELIKTVDKHDLRMLGFGTALFLHENKDGMLRTIVVDRIIDWGTTDGDSLYYIACDINDKLVLSMELSLASLQEVFLAVKRVLAKE